MNENDLILTPAGQEAAVTDGKLPEEIPEEVSEEVADAPEKADFPESAPLEGEAEAEGVNYGELLREDEETLIKSFPNLSESFKITDLKDPIRYGALRDMGLSPKEAYLATGGILKPRDNRAHLTLSVSGSAAKKSADIPRSELKIAREIFSDMSESDLQRLYRKVSG